MPPGQAKKCETPQTPPARYEVTRIGLVAPNAGAGGYQAAACDPGDTVLDVRIAEPVPGGVAFDTVGWRWRIPTERGFDGVTPIAALTNTSGEVQPITLITVCADTTADRSP